MPEVKQVIASVSNPIAPDDPGRVTIGYYVQNDSVLTMTDGNGDPVSSAGGDKESYRLQDGDNADFIAKRLAAKIHRRLRKNENGFNRPLVYSSR